MEDFSEATKKEECLFLPPGFRFHPTDEEIISEYLMKKALDHNFSAIAMAEVDLNKCEPWELPSKAKMGEKEWYFFSQKERRYPTGMRTNRATKSGYWKATGKDREIHKGKGILVGMKKTLVFYKGRAPKGQKTNWVMHEFRLDGDYSHHKASSKNDWAVARVFHKNEATKKNQVIEQLTANPNFACLGSSNFGFLHKEDAMARAPATANFTTTNASPSFIGQCSNSMMSTSIDTGVTNDWNNEISSYYDSSSFVSLCDFENMWT